MKTRDRKIGVLVMKEIHLLSIAFVCMALMLSCSEQASEQETMGPVMEWDEAYEEFAAQFLQRLGPDYDPKSITGHARYCFKTMTPFFREQEISLHEREALVALCLMSGIEFKQSQLEYDGLLNKEEKRQMNQSCINDIAAMGAPAESVCLTVIRAIAPLKKGQYQRKFPYVLTGYYAIFVLQHMKSSEAVPVLMEIASSQLELRGAAGRALGLIGDPQAVPVLRKLERDRKEIIRREARDAIRRIEQMPGATPLKNDDVTSPTDR